MPVKKSTAKSQKTAPVQQMGGCCKPKPKHKYGHAFVALLGTIFLIYLIFYIGTLIRTEIKEYEFIGRSDEGMRTISLQATGEVKVVPDVAFTTMGVQTEAETVEAAQDQNTQIMNKLLTELAAMGIAEKDMQTQDYNVYPQYDYTPDEGRELRGYQVSQHVRVRVRDIDKADEVLALAGSVGATNVGGLDLQVDDTDVYIEKARAEAIKELKEKVRMITGSLDVDVVGVVNYSENEPQDGGRPDMMYMEAKALGGGSAPALAAGENTVRMQGNVVFEIQ